METKINKRVKLFYLIKSNLSIILSWLISLAIALFFQNKISSFIAEHSIITYKEVKQAYFDFAYTIVVIILFIRFLWFFIKNYRVSKKHNYVIFLIGIIYILIRNNSNDDLWFSVYTQFFTFSFYYSDLIILISILSLLLLLRNVFASNYIFYDSLIKWFNDLKIKPTMIESSFLLEDIPVEETKLNDNEMVINELVFAVKNLKPSNSFIIGVNSIWGLGKTSFLKRLEHKLLNGSNDESQYITFWFNAWQHQDEKSIINNFFNQLKKELSTYSGDSENIIDSYLKEMLALVDNKYINFFKSVTESVFNGRSNTIKDFYNEINEIIEKIDRKIIVFVDDIDRLNKVEILETLRILRNIADFKNVVFICGFDREYVVKQSQIDNHYLDKIFNLEINLTTHNQRGFIVYLNQLITDCKGYTDDDKNLLTTAINKIFYGDEESLIDIDWLIDMTNQPKAENVSDELNQTTLIPSFFFESKRDVKKFFNELFINIKTLKNISDIELDEYILLKLLLFRYKWIYKNFTSKRMSSWLGYETTLKFDQLNLNSLVIYSDIDSHDKIIIYSILKNLFPPTGINGNSKNINQKRYFPLYLSNNIFNEAFSFTELTEALEENKIEELIVNKVLGKENENLIKNDIKNFVLKQENIKNINEYKQVISLIKNDHLGFVDEVEILDFIHLGETTFKDDFEGLLDTIFTNFKDSFGGFIQALSIHYSKIPNDVSFNNRNNIGSHYGSEKIKQFKILTKERLLELLLKIVRNEIELNEKNFNVVNASTFFMEMYFVLFDFRLYHKDFKDIAIKYFTDKFEDIFLSQTPRDTLISMDYPFFANIFENMDEREKIIEQANILLSGKNQWSSSDLNISQYVIKGWDNFILYVKGLRDKISPDKLDSYIDFLDWLYTNQKNDYRSTPHEKDFAKFRKDRENGQDLN